MDEPSRDLRPPLKPTELVAAVIAGTVFSLLCRVLDLVALLLRPRLLGPYLRLWAAELRRSPYRWPSSFESVRATRAAGQSRMELMYGEISLASAVLVFRRAGVRRGSRVVDLGAGRGRALLAARWLGAEARGVELLEAHVRAVRDALARAGAALEVGDAGEAEVAGSTHVFLNWCALEPATRARIVARLESCNSGTVFAAVTRPVEGPAFRPAGSCWALFTWGPERVYFSERL